LHPDVNTSEDAHQRFIELNEAFQILGNPIKRKRYDQLYHVQVLVKEPSKERVYQKKKEFWEKSVHTSANKGNAKGQKRAAKNQKNNTSPFWDATILFDLAAEII
jgi:DnaJ-class molecular chaperone